MQRQAGGVRPEFDLMAVTVAAMAVIPLQGHLHREARVRSEAAAWQRATAVPLIAPTPSRLEAHYRHFRDVVVRYPSWDLSLMDLVDPREGTILARPFPWDRAANADDWRAPLAPQPEPIAAR